MHLKHILGKILFASLLLFESSISAIDYEKFPTAYVQEKGEITILTAYWRQDTNHFFNRYGHKIHAENDYEFEEWNLYVAYGLTSKDTFSMKGAWARAEETLDGKKFGFEEIELSFKHCFGKRHSLLFSTELTAIMPLDRERKPAIQYGEYGFEINFLASMCTHWGSFLTQTDTRIGYRYYHGFPGDQIRTDYTFSLFPIKCLKVAGNLHLEYGLYDGNGSVKRWSCSFFRGNPHYKLLQGEVRVTLAVIRQMELTVGYHRHFWGRNIATGGGFMGEASLHF